MKKLIMLFTNSYTRSELYWKIRSFFIPQQRWLTKIIPRTYCDKVELVPRVLFAILVDFVEKEKGLSQLDVDWSKELEDGHISQDYIDDINRTYGELRDAYNYIKHERDALLAAQDDSYPKTLPTNDEKGNKSSLMQSCETLYGMSYAEAYAETIRLETLIQQRDQDAMMIIVRNVGMLWT